MARALQVGKYLATATLAASLMLLMVGLGMAARPELFAWLGVDATTRTGLAIALAAGIVATASAAFGRVLESLSTEAGDQNGPSPR